MSQAVIWLVSFLSVLSIGKAGYTVNLFLAEFSNPSGQISTGKHCDKFFFSGKDECDMSMKLCIEVPGQMTPGMDSCSREWYNFGQISTNSNNAEFRTDTYYGSFYNGGSFFVDSILQFNSPVLQLKLIVEDVDEGDATQLIDSMSLQIVPQNIYQASGSFVKFNHHNKSSGDFGPQTSLTLYYTVENGTTGQTTTTTPYSTSAPSTTETPIPCQNGGTPRNNNTCACPTPYYGPLCDKAPRRNCNDLYLYHGLNGNQMGTIVLNGKETKVYCEEGWTVIQRRVDDDYLFNKTWTEYKNGFGNSMSDGSFWLGNDNIYFLTNGDQDMSLEVDLWDCKTPHPNMATETYQRFSIESEDKNYTLHVSSSGNKGDAGDAFNQNSFEAIQNGQPFSVQNDSVSSQDCTFSPISVPCCANTFHGGWWYGLCGSATLNGIYHKNCKYQLPPGLGNLFGNGILWKTWYKDIDYSLSKTVMKIKPK